MYFHESYDACSSDQASQVFGQSQAKKLKRRKLKKYVSYAHVVEDEIMDYIVAHQFLYNHKLRDFWNAELKNLV